MNALYLCRRQPRPHYVEPIAHAVAALARSARRFLWRYGPAELAAIVVAVVGATVAAPLTTNDLVLVAVSVYGGSAAYYAVLARRDLIRDRKRYAARGVAYTRHAACRTLRALVVEFGSAEVLDSLVFSPVLMYVSIRSVAQLQSAVVLSEIAGSVAFYGAVFVAHRLRTAAWRTNGKRSADQIHVSARWRSSQRAQERWHG